MLEPLVKTIEVPCDQQTAFTVFIEIGSWWPTSRFATSVMRGSSVRRIRVDAREGGEIVEEGEDGMTHRWGRIVTYQPPAYLKMDFHVPHPSETNPGVTTVEVRFTPLDAHRTHVELTQSNWEGLGDAAPLAQGGYKQAWVMILEGAYRSACAERARV